MWAREIVAICLSAMLFAPWCAQKLVPSILYAQGQPPSQQRIQPPQADGQWHRFGEQGAPTTNRPPHPPQNQPGHAGNWLRRYKDLPPAQQRKALQSDPQFRKLSAQQQARLLQRLQHFSSLPADRQERVLSRMETWEHLTSDQKQQARQVFQEFRMLPPDRRQAVEKAIRQLRGLTQEQRQRFINSDQYQYEFSPQERGIIAGASRLPLAPGDSW